MKESTQLEVLLSFNSFSTILQVFKRFPSIRLLQYLFVPFRKLRLFAAVEREIRQSVLHRIEERGRTKHADFFDYILPAKEEVPTSEMELLHIGSVALQVMFAGWSPMADLFYGVFALLLDDPDSYAHLVHEIRTQFTRYDDITSGQLSSLPFLQACIEETLRLLPNNLTGLPRISPGAVVDGRYIAKGVSSHASSILSNVIQT